MWGQKGTEDKGQAYSPSDPTTSLARGLHQYKKANTHHLHLNQLSTTIWQQHQKPSSGTAFRGTVQFMLVIESDS